MNEEERNELVNEYLELKAAQKIKSNLNICEACVFAADHPWPANHANCKGKAFCFCQHSVILNGKRYTYKVKADHA